MKILLVGYGSIGQRHAHNLRVIMPDVALTIEDPAKGFPPSLGKPDAVIIATPTAWHEDYMRMASQLGAPAYVEKPLGTLWTPPYPRYATRWATGFQYRFHPAAAVLQELVQTENVLRFHARDNLLGRYGPDVAGIMASHAIDLALWLLGPALRVELHSDGVALTGHIQHRGGASLYDYRMDAGVRESYVTVRGKRVDLPADDGMYVEALRAWLNLVKGGERDSRTATLASGLMVERVLRSVQP